MNTFHDYYNTDEFAPEFLHMMELVNELGPTIAKRAIQIDKDASFPTENYEDFAKLGFLRLVIPKEFGGFGFSLGQYTMIGAEIGKYCGATALTFNMHTSSMMWSRFMYELPNLTDADRAAFAPLRERQFRNVVENNAIYSQPISEGGTNWTSKPIQTNCKKVEGGYLINGFKKFASLAGYCDYYSIVCTEHFEGIEPRHEDTMNFAVHKDTPGLEVIGEWDPIGMRGTHSKDLVLKDVFVKEEEMMMPQGMFVRTLPQWPHMMATLTPAYMGVAQGAYDYTVKYLRGEVEGLPPIDRRVYPTKRATVAKMFQKLTEMRALWHTAFMEARGFPSKAQVMRLYAAQYAVMEGVQEMTALAIRTCGGQSMLKSLPLERMYRDSRCGALMLPYTTEIMEDYLSVLTLYDMDKIDEASSDTASARISMWRPAATDAPLAAE
ncbi:acyl-CoA dehydrogenase family protein [Parasedimentitalea maritima]|uniref:Acyl-CoA dehydrogenase n=1 Tax=Parasedimentitalea maritima TaxID=2578117 RepID=A0A6A4RAQ0_9RHOB|nr:acyl-CoA dehydrogenase family protein [Zongyanglinia marina]KAE9627221.1 acyl-CoA dehydrogenase [Zongyanglinia marina]